MSDEQTITVKGGCGGLTAPSSHRIESPSGGAAEPVVPWVITTNCPEYWRGSFWTSRRRKMTQRTLTKDILARAGIYFKLNVGCPEIGSSITSSTWNQITLQPSYPTGLASFGRLSRIRRVSRRRPCNFARIIKDRNPISSHIQVLSHGPAGREMLKSSKVVCIFEFILGVPQNVSVSCECPYLQKLSIIISCTFVHI